MVLRLPFSVLVISPEKYPNLALAIRFREDDNAMVDWMLERVDPNTVEVFVGFDGSNLRPFATYKGRIVKWIGTG